MITYAVLRSDLPLVFQDAAGSIFRKKAATILPFSLDPFVNAAKQHNIPVQRLDYCTIDSVFLYVFARLRNVFAADLWHYALRI